MKVRPRVRKGGQVIVVGAGFAGLAAARDLQCQGYQVIVLEARDRIGGRVLTDHSFGFPVDLGAAWLHGGSLNPLKLAADWIGVSTRATDYRNTVVYGDDGAQVAAGDLKSWLFLPWLLCLSAPAVLRSLGHRVGLFRKSSDLVRILDRAARWLVFGRSQLAFHALCNATESGYAASGEGLSFARQFIRSETRASIGTFPAGERVVTAGMERLLTPLATGLSIRLGEAVHRVKYRRGRVELTTMANSYEADATVLTIPLGVLKSGAVTFDPPLPPEHQAAMARLAMGVFNKVILEFPYVAWPADRDFLAIAMTDASIPFFLNLQLYFQRPVLVGLAGGRFGRQIEVMSDTRVVAGAVRDLSRALGSRFPDPNRVLITRWGADPFALGSYSTLPPAADGSEAATLARPIEDTVFFAGEATHPHDPSTVHGAYWSGERAAAQVAGKNVLKAKKVTSPEKKGATNLFPH